MLHGIVTSHGGLTHVTSELGRGTTMEIHLPASRMAEPERPTATPPTASASSQRQRVLLVDDEDAVAGVIRRLLERNGFNVTLASNGVQALERVAAHPAFDLILTDQTMPMMTGLELVERLRATGHHTPIILASGFGASIDGERVAHCATCTASTNHLPQRPAAPGAQRDRGILSVSRYAPGWGTMRRYGFGSFQPSG